MQTKTLFRQTLISYTILGSGKPVVLIHGFGEDGSIWDGQVAFLKDHFQLIIPDLPGSGGSAMLPGNEVQISDYAEVIKAVLDAEKIPAATIIGHSMGGYIALAFAGKYPGYLSALGLFHSGAYADDEEKKATRRKAISFIEQNGSKAFLETSVAALFFDAEKSKADIDRLIAKAPDFSPAALTQYYHAMIQRPDTTQILRSFPPAVLFIIGVYDKAIPFAHSLQQSHIPAHAHIHILRNSAHMGMCEERGKANRILAQFLHTV